MLPQTPFDLRPLDALITHKAHDFSLWPPRAFADWALDGAILLKSRARYPDGSHHGNHCRVYVGRDRVGNDVVFEWTYPTARFVHLEPWMTEAPYARVYRYRHCGAVERGVFEYFARHAGVGYDWLQLAGIALGLRWLQLGEGREVCSTGLREAQEYLWMRYPLFAESETWQTLPCAWCNHPDDFELVSGALRASALEPEPRRRTMEVHPVLKAEV